MWKDVWGWEWNGSSACQQATQPWKTLSPKPKRRSFAHSPSSQPAKPPTQLDIFIFTQVYGALYLSLVFVIADIADCHIKYNTSFTDPRFVSFSFFSPQVEFFQRPCTTKIGWVFGWVWGYQSKLWTGLIIYMLNILRLHGLQKYRYTCLHFHVTHFEGPS